MYPCTLSTSGTICFSWSDICLLEFCWLIGSNQSSLLIWHPFLILIRVGTSNPFRIEHVCPWRWQHSAPTASPHVGITFLLLWDDWDRNLTLLSETSLSSALSGATLLWEEPLLTKEEAKDDFVSKHFLLTKAKANDSLLTKAEPNDHFVWRQYYWQDTTSSFADSTLLTKAEAHDNFVCKYYFAEKGGCKRQLRLQELFYNYTKINTC